MKLRKSKDFRYLPDALEHSVETFMRGRDWPLQGSCISNTVYQFHFLMPVLDSGELLESAETPSKRRGLRTETKIHVDVKLFAFSLLRGNERVKTDASSTLGSLRSADLHPSLLKVYVFRARRDSSLSVTVCFVKNTLHLICTGTCRPSAGD